MLKALKTNKRLDYIITPLLSLLTVLTVLELWSANLAVPLNYRLDALVYSSWIKGIIENGWWLTNPSLGAPFGQNLYDFPYPATASLQVILFKLIGAISQNHWLTHNIYYLLTFPLITITSLFCLRELGVSRYVSVMGSILFAFVPYHFFHFVNHLFSSGYYTVPLAILLAVWIFKERELFFRIGKEKISRRFFIASGFATLLAISDIHYAFFGSFLILVAGLSGAIVRRNYRPLANALVLITLLSTIVVACLIPTIAYHNEFGSNPVAAKRSPAEADTYALKIIQMLLPVKEHRVPALNQVTDKYYVEMGFLNEASYATLGIVASMGFVITLLWLFLGRFSRINDEATRASLDILSILNGGALLLGTVGGFGTIFAFLISPQIRVYNRISIFIAFISLSAVCIVIDNIIKSTSNNGKSTRWLFAAMCTLSVVGVLDQTSPSYVQNYEKIAMEFNNDKNFISKLEATLPPNSMIFQLPYIPFPENGTVLKMTDYQHMKGYLHSKNLLWSYGAVKGREAAHWGNRISGKPVAELVQDVSVVGFQGIYLDRYGYDDNGRSIVAEISALTQSQPTEDQNGRYVFFPLQKYNQAMLSKPTNLELEEMKSSALHPVYVEWQQGCYDLEQDATRTWHWCSDNGTFTITNGRDIAQDATVSMTFFTNYDQSSILKFESDVYNGTFSISNKGTPFTTTLHIPPGTHVIHFSTDAPQVVAPLDTRDLHFHIDNFKIH